MKLKVLVADDASFIRDLIKRTLRQHMPFAEVHEAINGNKARAMLKKDQFHLILCDWEMPEVSGLELLEWLRAFELEKGLDKTPFVMVTSRGSRDHVVKAVQAGVNDYIGKPFTAEQLVNKAMKALGKHRALIKEIMSGRKPSSDQSPVNLAAEQSALLTGTALSSPNPEPDKAAPVSQKNAAKAKGQAVRFRVGKEVLTAALLDISLTEVILVCPRYDQASILCQAVIDMPVANSQELSLNCLIYGLQAEQKHVDAKAFRVRLRLIDDDAEKMSQLSKLIANF